MLRYLASLLHVLCLRDGPASTLLRLFDSEIPPLFPQPATMESYGQLRVRIVCC